MQTIKIDLRPEELVDMIEDGLAWLATANVGIRESRASRDMHYVQREFRRAEPFFKFAGETVGMDTKGIETTVHMAGDILARVVRLYSELGESLCYARLDEVAPTSPVVTLCGRFVQDSDLVDGRFDVSLVKGAQWVLRSVAAVGSAESKLLFQGTRTPNLRALRLQEVIAFRDGRSYCDQHYAAVRPDGVLLNYRTGLSLDFEASKLVDEKVQHPFTLQFGEGVASQLRRKGEWTVELSLTKDRTGIGLSTDSIGAREIANTLRASDTRKGRKKALLHWVKEHYRQKRDGDVSLVKSHMRGAVSCDAGGLWCTIWPSRNDIEKASNGKRFSQIGLEA